MTYVMDLDGGLSQSRFAVRGHGCEEVEIEINTIDVDVVDGMFVMLQYFDCGESRRCRSSEPSIAGQRTQSYPRRAF